MSYELKTLVYNKELFVNTFDFDFSKKNNDICLRSPILLNKKDITDEQKDLFLQYLTNSGNFNVIDTYGSIVYVPNSNN